MNAGGDCSHSSRAERHAEHAPFGIVGVKRTSNVPSRCQLNSLPCSVRETFFGETSKGGTKAVSQGYFLGMLARGAPPRRAGPYLMTLSPIADRTDIRYSCRLSCGNDHPHADQLKSPAVAPTIPSHTPQSARSARQPYPCFVPKTISSIAPFQRPNPDTPAKSP